MTQNRILVVAGISGFIAVAIGAFGAHALKTVLTANGRLDTFELAVRYQFYHTLALLAVGILIEKFTALKASFLIFSGSLYIISLTNQTIWGAVTPIGGLALIAGWLSLVWTVMRQKN
jgi:uncharacterized membrane protein YgdD (TMEM256/DUF423 family)